jgi:hypothetical protein
MSGRSLTSVAVVFLCGIAAAHAQDDSDFSAPTSTTVDTSAWLPQDFISGSFTPAPLQTEAPPSFADQLSAIQDGFQNALLNAAQWGGSRASGCWSITTRPRLGAGATRNTWRWHLPFQ